jgi:hypothetical protein
MAKKKKIKVTKTLAMKRKLNKIVVKNDQGKVIKKDTRAERLEALDEIGEFLVDEILSNAGEGKTSVKNGKWKKGLSKDYAAKKSQVSGETIANMELTGDMLDSLTYRVNKSKMELEVGFFEDEQAKKADNHNKFSAKSKKTKVPARQSIPRKKEKFRKSIETGVGKIIRDFED